MNQQEDIDCIKEVLGGNTAAFERLVMRHQKNVFNIIYKIIGNIEDTEELAQDVFIKVYKSLATFKGTSKFSTWLYRIAYHASISAYRKKKVILLPINEEVVKEEGDTSFFDDFEDLEGLKHTYLPMALEMLEKEDQLILSLYYQQNLPISEIASITSMSKSNVKIRLFRSRKLLYTYITEQMGVTKA